MQGYEHIEEALSFLKKDRSHGAVQLARFALESLASAAQSLDVTDSKALRGQLSQGAAELAASRPSMAPVITLLYRYEQALADLPEDLTSARQKARMAALELIQLSEDALVAAAKTMATRIPAGSTIFFHSYSSTAFEVFHHLDPVTHKVIVTESRPMCEGVASADHIAGLGFDTTLITDAQAGLFVKEADLVMVGADAILSNGDLVNKVGTYPLALLAATAQVPFYVVCESFKQFSKEGAGPTLEEMDVAELGHKDLEGVTLRNIYFDVTPADLVTQVVNEESR